MPFTKDQLDAAAKEISELTGEKIRTVAVKRTEICKKVLELGEEYIDTDEISDETNEVLTMIQDDDTDPPAKDEDEAPAKGKKDDKKGKKEDKKSKKDEKPAKGKKPSKEDGPGLDNLRMAAKDINELFEEDDQINIPALSKAELIEAIKEAAEHLNDDDDLTASTWSTLASLKCGPRFEESDEDEEEEEKPAKSKKPAKKSSNDDDDDDNGDDDEEDEKPVKKGKKAAKEDKKSKKEEKGKKSKKDEKPKKKEKEKKEKSYSRPQAMKDAMMKLCKKGATTNEIIELSDELYVKHGGQSSTTAAKNTASFGIPVLEVFGVIRRDGRKVVLETE